MSALDDVICRVRPAAGASKGALVLLHGRGTDELDLAPLIDLLDPNAELVGVTARAPLTLPPGGSHWYVSRSVGYPDRPTFDQTYALMSGWLDALQELTGHTIDQTVLGGFSQGAVMSYALGLGAGRPSPAALVGLSGFIPQVEQFELELDGRDGLPVAIGHGSGDPVIPVELGRAANELLAGAGFDVIYREYPLAHMVDPNFLEELRPWMLAALG
jgi:phospholipase/carboxylesterase